MEAYLSKYTIGSKKRGRNSSKNEKNHHSSSDHGVKRPHDEEKPSTPHAGLQTKVEIEATKRARLAAFQKEKKNVGLSAKTDTVYRDLSGQKIKPSEANSQYVDRKEIIKQEREKRKKEDAKVNRSEADIVRKFQELAQLKEVANKGINRYENDEAVNEEAKTQLKSEDPAIQFDKKIKKQYEKNKHSKNVSVSGRKLYPGSYPSNRFGIKPGYRWDGVDRSNGFEQRWYENQ